MTKVNCNNCGAEIVGAAFCGACGTAAPEPTAPAPVAAEPVAEAAPAAAATVAATATATVAPPAPGPQLPGLPGLPSGIAPAGAKPAGAGKGKAIGMGVAALIGIVALVKVFTGGGDPIPTQPEGPQTGSQEQPGAQGPTGPAQPEGPVVGGDGTTQPEQQAQGGGLRDFIADPVGEFQLAQGGQLSEYIERGALDAYQLVYQTADGRQVVHVLVALPDPNGALSSLHAFAQGLQEQGYQLQEQGEVVIDGQKVGEAFVLAGQNTVIGWSNGQLFAFVSGAGNDPISFYQQIPY